MIQKAEPQEFREARLIPKRFLHKRWLKRISAIAAGFSPSQAVRVMPKQLLPNQLWSKQMLTKQLLPNQLWSKQMLTKQLLYKKLMALKLLPMLLFSVLILPALSHQAAAQIISSERYEVGIAPDLWFNSVDGIIVGARFRGEDPRTFLDGPHRIRAGIWLGTRLPDHPVSYAFSYAHPIAAITDVNSEGGIRLSSSMRTGLHLHEAGLHKRWQPGFDEFVSTEAGFHAGLYKRFDFDYLLYEALWQENSVAYLRSELKRRDRNRLGRWTLAFSGMTGLPASTNDPFIGFSGQAEERPELLGQEGLFGLAQLEWVQQAEVGSGFHVRSRVFGGASTDAVPQEHRFMTSDAAAFEWHNSAFTRARGSIPVSWMRSGWIHVPGGPGLRGYTFRTTDLLEAGLPAWSQHAMAWNLEFGFPNPVNNYFARIPYAGDLLKLDSYLFFDAGYLHDGDSWQDPLMNAGAGLTLSLNIEDYLGRDRGFFLRYELPVWLSETWDDESNFRLRHLLGLGMVIRL